METSLELTTRAANLICEAERHYRSTFENPTISNINPGSFTIGFLDENDDLLFEYKYSLKNDIITLHSSVLGNYTIGKSSDQINTLIENFYNYDTTLKLICD